jgi:metal transporter CNNM
MNILLVVIEVVLLVTLSAICSGLNIALMSLQLSDLKRQAKLGNIYARRVLPLRKNSHLTLTSIIFTNIGVISATSLVLDQHLNGLVAGTLSTLLIVIFGEVLPQTWFSRYALSFCARFAPLLKLMVIVSYPVSKPLQLMLDKIIGREGLQLHSRGELGLIISEHLIPGASELDEDEVEIMRGALSLSEKRVRSIMTSMNKVYTLTPDTLIDGKKIDEIKDKSWSRIPIINKERTTCLGVLLMKDLVDIDFDERPYRVDGLPLHPTKAVGSLTALDTLFRKFIAAKSHLMPVERDDEIIGIVTIEDLLEEILGHEIEDESDHSRNI